MKMKLTQLFFQLGRTSNDPLLWRQTLILFLKEVFQARMVILAERPIGKGGIISKTGETIFFSDENTRDRSVHQDSVDRVNQQGDFLDNPYYLTKALPSNETIGFSGYELLGEEAYTRNPFVQGMLNRVNCGDGLLLAHRQEKAQIEIHLFKSLDAAPFKQLEIKTGKSLNENLQEIYDQLPPLSKPSMLTLPPRQRQVLSLLIKGYGEKEIARALALSQSTIHDYVKAIYLHYGVSSRAELLSTFFSGQRGLESITPFALNDFF
jgi:DNA-binding CsgD family transcriptional regulator